MDKIFGVDLALYKFYAIKNGKKVASVNVIKYTKFGAYVEAKKNFPDHDSYDYEHIRFAKDGETVGVILTKNDKKRKI